MGGRQIMILRKVCLGKGSCGRKTELPNNLSESLLYRIS